MEMTVHYRSSRKEVNEWYWKKWREKLWLYHIGFFILIVVISVGRWPPRTSFDVLRGVIIGLLAVLGFIAFPQIMFKPKERWLTINENGIDTEIGKIKAHIGWNEVSKVEQASHAIVITRKKSGNAFIVPKRAFQSQQEREAFYGAVREWQDRRDSFEKEA
jgi:hypothetical protein